MVYGGGGGQYLYVHVHIYIYVCVCIRTCRRLLGQAGTRLQGLHLRFRVEGVAYTTLNTMHTRTYTILLVLHGARPRLSTGGLALGAARLGNGLGLWGCDFEIPTFNGHVGRF